MSYTEDKAENCTFKVGEKVTIIRKENHWGTAGWNDVMDKYIGKTFKILRIDRAGVQLDTPIQHFWFPYYVLRRPGVDFLKED